MESVVEQTTRERAQKAVTLRDQGKVDEATKLFKENVADIKAYVANGGKPSAELNNLSSQYDNYANRAAAAAPAQWNVYRKQLRALDMKEAGSKSKY